MYKFIKLCNFVRNQKDNNGKIPFWEIKLVLEIAMKSPEEIKKLLNRK